MNKKKCYKMVSCAYNQGVAAQKATEPGSSIHHEAGEITRFLISRLPKLFS